MSLEGLYANRQGNQCRPTLDPQEGHGLSASPRGNKANFGDLEAAEIHRIPKVRNRCQAQGDFKSSLCAEKPQAKEGILALGRQRWKSKGLKPVWATE